MTIISPTQVREIINGISQNPEVQKHCWLMKGQPDPEDIQALFQTMLAGCFRTGELCGAKYLSDKNKPTGHTLKVHQETYTPDDSNQDEIDTLTQRLYIQNIRAGKREMPTLEQILSIREPVLIIQVQVEKRKDLFVRHTALPMRPELEPLANPIYEYIKKRQNKNEIIFPYNRMQMLRLAHKIFNGYHYKIRPYRRDTKNENGEVIKKLNSKGELKAVRETVVPTKPKPFGDHAVRHAGIEEKKKIGIRGPRLTAFIGWSPKGEEILEEVYDQNDPFTACRLYLPYLITRRI